MGLFFYNLGIRLYALLIRVASPFNEKAKKFRLGRQQLFPHLEATFKDNKAPIAWFHCASLGEFEQGRPVIEGFRKQFPEYKVLLTFFSPSGYEVRKNYAGADYISYLPIDTAQNAQRFVQLINPQFVFFVKYEFWYHYLEALSQTEAWIFSISTIFRTSQPFFKWYGKLHRQMLQHFDHFFVQTQNSAALLRSIDIHQASVSGDTRFDRVMALREKVEAPELLQQFTAEGPVLIAGSTWKADMEVIAPYLQSHPKVKAIIAPHEISEENIRFHENQLPSVIRWSRCSGQVPTEQVIIIDSVGMLSALYSLGDWAYIGGAFGKGLHNILEAATFGLPVVFGDKNYQKFQEARDLLAQKGAFTVHNSEEFTKLAERLSFEETFRKEAGAIAAHFVEERQGATQKILQYCQQMIAKA